MFNGYNQPTYESDAGRDSTLKKSGHTAPWNYSQSYYNNSDLQQANSSGSWQQKLPYPNVPGKCACVQCQQGPWYHKEVEPTVPSSVNPDMMALGAGIGGGGTTDYSMEAYPRPEAYMRNNVQFSKKNSSCSYPTPNPQMYSHRLPNIKQNVSEFTNFERNSDQYMRMFEASSYGRKPADSRPKYWDSVNGAFYPPQQYQFAPPCRYPPYNPPFYYPNTNQSQPYQRPQQNGIQPYYGIGPNPMRPMEIPQPMAHTYLKQDNISKISPLRLMRKKKLAESIGQPSPPRMAQVTDNTPALDVRRFLATWADEDEESPSVPQMVVLDCQDINAEQAELLRLYESSTSVRLVQEPCLEQVTRSEHSFVPSKSTEEALEEQSVVDDTTLPSTTPAEYTQEVIPPAAEVRDPPTESQQADESNGSPLPSPASTANSQDSLPVLADLPTSEYRKNKFLDYDQQPFPLLPAKPPVTETMAVSSSHPLSVGNPTEEIEKSEKKNSRKRSRKPTIKFSIQKSHDLKISLRVLNESKGDLEQDAKNKLIDRKDEVDKGDLITVSLDRDEDNTLHNISQKRAKKLKKRRLLEQTYSVSSEDHFNDVTPDGFQVEESVDSAKIKLTFKRRKGELEQDVVPKKRKKAKRIKEEKNNKSKLACCDWKAASPEGPPAADTTTDFYGQPPAHPTDHKLETPQPSPSQISISDFPENVSSCPTANENIPTFPAFDQPDSSHENSGNKNVLSQNSNTSSPKISSSCHITSPRTSTDSIERELQAIWSGRSSNAKFNDDDRITSNDNVVDFYTEDISTGPINVEPLEHQSSDALSFSLKRKSSSPFSDIIGQCTNRCSEKTENYKQLNENLAEGLRSPTSISNCESFHTNSIDDDSVNKNLPVTISMAPSPRSDVSTITNAAVDNSSKPSLSWGESVFKEIPLICNPGDNASTTNNSNSTYDDRNGATKQSFVRNHFDESNRSTSLKNAEIDSEYRFIENEIPVTEATSAIIPKNPTNIMVKDILDVCNEPTVENSDRVLFITNNNELINDGVNQVKLTKKEGIELSLNTDCLKSPTCSSKEEAKQSENDLVDSEFCTSLSFEGELDNSRIIGNKIEDLEENDLNNAVPVYNVGNLEPNLELDLLSIPSDKVYEKGIARLGPRTPEGSPSLLNSSVSPPHSEYCESPYNRNPHNCSDECAYKAIDCRTNIHHNSKEMSNTNSNNEVDSMVLKSAIEEDETNYLKTLDENSVDVECEIKSPLNSKDLNNEENIIKESIDFNSNHEPGNISLVDSINLNKTEYECEVNTFISSGANYELNESLDLLDLRLKNEKSLKVSPLEVQGSIEVLGTDSMPLENKDAKCDGNSPIDSFALDSKRNDGNLVKTLINNNEGEKLLGLDNTKEEDIATPSLSPLLLNRGIEMPELTANNLDNVSKQCSFQTLLTANKKCVTNSTTYSKKPSEEMCIVKLPLEPVNLCKEEGYIEKLPLNPVNLIYEGQDISLCISSDSTSLSGGNDEELEKDESLLASVVLTRKENEVELSLLSISDCNETEEQEKNTSLNSNEEKRADQQHEAENWSPRTVSKWKLCENPMGNLNSEDLTMVLKPPVSPICSKPSDDESEIHQVDYVENETKKVIINISPIQNENNSSADEDNLSENITKTFITFNCISPLSSPQGIEDKTDSDKYRESVSISDGFVNNESMDSIELEADENANIIIGVEESADLDDGNGNEYIFEKPSTPPAEKHETDSNEVYIETDAGFNEELHSNKLEEEEIIEEEEEYIVVSDEYAGPIMMEDGVLIEISNEDSLTMNVKIEDIPLPHGDAPKENCFDYRRWLENNSNRDGVLDYKCVSPFTSEVLGMYRNPSPPGTPSLLMSPTSPRSIEVSGPAVLSEMVELDEECDGLPDDAEFQHVMENCMANARKFLSREIDEKRIDNPNDQVDDNVNRKDVLLSSFETHSDLEIGCDASSSEVTIAFSPFNTVIASETLPVDNWPYLEEEVPSSPQWPTVNEEDIPLQESEKSVKSSPPNTSWPEEPLFELEEKSKYVPVSNRLPRIRRRTFDAASNNKVRTGKFLSERKLNESDDELEIISDFKCHLSLDRLALKDVIDKKAVSSRTRKKSIEEELGKLKSEDFTAINWQPKVVLRRMAMEKESFSKNSKSKNLSCSSERAQRIRQCQLIPKETKLVENIENIPKEKTVTSIEVPSESQFQHSPPKGPSKLTLSNYMARKGLSKHTKSHSIISESQEKKDIRSKSHDRAKTRSKLEMDDKNKEKKKLNEKQCNVSKSSSNKVKFTKLDCLNSSKQNNNAHKLKPGSDKGVFNEQDVFNSNEPKIDVVDNKYVIVKNNELINKSIKVSDSPSKKYKEERNRRIDKLKSRSSTKKSSHKKKVIKAEINENLLDNSKPFSITPDLSPQDGCKLLKKPASLKANKSETLKKNELSFTNCNTGEDSRKFHNEDFPINNVVLDDENSDNSEPWVCAVCGFDDLKQQQKHIQEHAFHCQGCHLAFISEGHFIKHLSKKHEDIRKVHHCLLCELSFETIELYNEHLQTREHKHLEDVEKSTIHTLFTLLCGEPCPVIGPVPEKPEWLPNQAGTVHFYHQATPLSLATQYWKKRQNSTVNKQ